MTNLIGEWQAVSATLNGAPQQGQEYQNLVLKFDGNEYAVLKEKSLLDSGTISLHSGGKMDIASKGETGKGKLLKAIYRLSGDTLTICYDLTGKAWPDSFESKSADQRYLVTYKKQLNLDFMKKIIILFGVIAGAIVTTFMFAARPLWENGTITFDNGMFIGYTSMVIALSMVFFGTKSYRDNHLGGIISFGKAFKIGILISVIASFMYAIGWEFYYNFYAPDFADVYAQHMIEKSKLSGASEQEVQALMDQNKKFIETYSNPLIRFGMTLTEILPVGLLITLISSFLLTFKKLTPAGATK